jgi:SnoaL-like domain
MSASVEAAVLAAADAIIDDFGHHRTAEYFAGFAADSTFVFHTAGHRLESRAEYEQLWSSWERDDGFRVHSCESTARRVQLLDTVAIFTHDVRSAIELGGTVETTLERETIVFQRRDWDWIAVHEHLSLPTVS